jgi:hypothetical protein
VTNLTDQLLALLVISLAVWSTSTTIAVARIFEPVRNFVKRRNDYLGEGVSCQRCISHWIAFAYVGVFLPRLLNSGFLFVDFFVSAMAVVGISDMIARTMSRLQRPNPLESEEQRSEREKKERRSERDNDSWAARGLLIEAQSAERAKNGPAPCWKCLSCPGYKERLRLRH